MIRHLDVAYSTAQLNVQTLVSRLWDKQEERPWLLGERRTGDVVLPIIIHHSSQLLSPL